MLYAKLRKRTQTLQRPKNLLMLYLYLILKGKRKGIEAKIKVKIEKKDSDLNSNSQIWLMKNERWNNEKLSTSKPIAKSPASRQAGKSQKL